jgi:putative transposase
VSHTTYVRNYECFIYISTVIDLGYRRVVGWSMDTNMDKHLVICALLMAVYQRRPQDSVLVHRDQASQYGSSDYHAFIKEHNLKPSISSSRELP